MEIEAKCSREKIYIYIFSLLGSLFRWDLKYRDQILDRSPANLPRKKNEINRSRGGDLGIINISKISPPWSQILTFIKDEKYCVTIEKKM